MDISIGMKHARIEKFRDDLTRAIEESEPARAANPHAVTEVVIYARSTGIGDEGEVIITLNNDDMERPEVPDDEVYVEVSE